VKQHRHGKRVARLALVEATIRSPPQSRIADPIQREESAFAPSDFPECFRQRAAFAWGRSGIDVEFLPEAFQTFYTYLIL
jgi:hypothetical protein